MRVLARIDRDKFICECSDVEIEKFMNLYYGKMAEPKVGDVIDLAKGHDFADDAKRAMSATAELIRTNGKVIRAIVEGVAMFGPQAAATPS